MSPATRPVAVVGLVVVALVATVGVSEWQAAHAHEAIPWRATLADASGEARAADKMVFAYFTASWCGPCQEMKHTTWADGAVATAMQRRYVPVKIDVDAHRDIAAAYQVNSMPTFVVLDGAGHKLRAQSGYMDAREMTDWLEKR